MALNQSTRPKTGFLDKVLARLNQLDRDGLRSFVQRLQRERVLLETLFNTIEDGIVVLDHEGRVVRLNQAAARLLSVSVEGALNQPVHRILPDLDPDALRPMAHGGVVRLEFEIQFPRPRYVRLYAAPIQDDPEAGHLLVLHDATEVRHHTREVVEAERVHALTLLAASVAHEIGNPLNALHIHLQLMEREVRKLKSADADAGAVAGRLQGFLDVAKGEVSRLDYIITDFLRAMRPSAPVLQDGSLNTVVQETTSLLGPELENRRLHVVIRLGRGLPEVRLDAAQLKQALVNLIKNAMQAMTKGGTLTLATGSSADEVWLTVSDTGSGIAADQLNRLFQPFHTTKAKGTGLGLMIVQRIVRDHGGRIDVESEVGRGTTFKIRLPRHKLIALELPPAGGVATEPGSEPDTGNP